MNKILGIGSRIDHPEYGKGVVTNVTAKMYWVTFIDRGLETIDVADTFEVIEAAEDEVDTVSFYEVEKSLRDILKKWSDVSEIVPIADKYRGGQNASKLLRKSGFLACGIGLPVQNVEGDMNGIRFGTPELVRWGMTSKDANRLASLISKALDGQIIIKEVSDWRKEFSKLHFMN